MALVLPGTSGNDTITVLDDFSGGVQITINSNVYFTGNDTVQLDALGGNDSINVHSVSPGTTLSVNCGDDNDTVRIGGNDFDSNVRGVVVVSGDAGGVDSIVVEDASDNAADPNSYSLSNTVFRKTLGGSVTYFGVEAMSVSGSQQADTVEILSTPKTMALTWTSNGGTDNIFIGDGTLSVVEGSVFVAGGSETDQIILQDQQAGTGQSYHLLTSGVRNYNRMGDLNFSQTEAVAVYGTLGADTFTIDTGSGSIAMVLSGFGGDDAFNIFSSDYTNQLPQQPVALVGGDDTDTINWLLAPSNLPYATTATQLSRNGMPTYDYVAMENINIRGSTGADVIAVGSIHSDIQLVINGGDSSDTFLLGPTLKDFNRALTINGDEGSDVLVVRDTLDNVSRTFSFAPGLVTRTGASNITYNSIAAVQAMLGSGHDTINVPTFSGPSLQIDSGPGNDQFNLGAGNLDADFQDGIKINGNLGTDQINFDNSLDTTYETWTVNSDGLADDHYFDYVIDNVYVKTGPGGGTINMDMVPCFYQIYGNSGPDIVNIGAGNLDNNLKGQINFLGDSGDDRVVIDDHLDSGADSYRWDSLVYFTKTPAGGNPSPLIIATAESVVLQANDDHNNITVEKTYSTAPLSIFANGGNDVVTVLDTDGYINVDTGADGKPMQAPFRDKLIVNSDPGAGDQPALVKLAANDSIGELVVNEGGTFQVPTNTTVRVTDTMTLKGTIDLRGAMLVPSSVATPGALLDWLKNGYATGAWNGTSPTGAIQSQVAATSNALDGLGYGTTGAMGDPSPLGITSIGGFDIGFNPTLIRYTLNGDANLDQNVNISDLGVLATNWQGTGKLWTQGDFNYDGSVNVGDLGSLATNWQKDATFSAPMSSSPKFSRRPIEMVGELRATECARYPFVLE